MTTQAIAAPAGAAEQPRVNPAPVTPPAPPVDAPVPAAPPAGAPAPAPGGDGLAEAIAALTQAMQAQAPVQTEEPPAQPQDHGPTDLNSVDIGDIEDPLLQSMAYALTAGVQGDLDYNRALGLAIERGDPRLVDRAYLVDKFGPAEAAHRIRIAEGIVTAVAEQSQAAADSVYSVAGGKEAWSAAAAAFNKQAPKALRSAVVQMLDSGNKEYIGHAGQLVVEFARAQGLVPKAGGGVTPQAGFSAGQALSKEAFQAELAKLDTRDRGYAQQRASLIQRRQLGRNLNL